MLDGHVEIFREPSAGIQARNRIYIKRSLYRKPLGLSICLLTNNRSENDLRSPIAPLAPCLVMPQADTPSGSSIGNVLTIDSRPYTKI